MDLDDSSQWRDNAETRLGTLEATAAEHQAALTEQARLRATMDSDMSDLKVEFRAQRSMLQALHDTQQDHTARLTRVEGALQLVRVGMEAIHGKLDTLLERE